MMIKKLAQSRAILTVSRVFKTDPSRTLTTTTTNTASSPETSLFSRIFKAPNPKLSIIPVLDEWVKEERSISVDELRKIIRQLRKFRRIKHALEVSFSLYNTHIHTLFIFISMVLTKLNKRDLGCDLLYVSIKGC